jgi:hypothetical protein
MGTRAYESWLTRHSSTLPLVHLSILPLFQSRRGKSRLGTKFSETRRPDSLCNGMKTSGHEHKLHLGGTAKPGIQKTLDCHRDLWNLCGRP